MKLSRGEFQSRYKAGTLRLALIGMSNIGKSYSGMRLATHFDFTLIEVDKLIWEELGETDMDAYAEWMGQPYSDGYEARERESIAIETRATRKSLSIKARNALLDTTGSVIYTDEDVLEQLKRDWFIVYIKAAEAHLDKLKQLYFAQPKPLNWHGHYDRSLGKTEDDALLESYPKLLESRASAYSDLADHVITSEDILTPDHDALFRAVQPIAK